MPNMEMRAEKSRRCRKGKGYKGDRGTLGSNPLGTEPSVVVKRYTSGALAFQGSCMTICKLSYNFNK